MKQQRWPFSFVRLKTALSLFLLLGSGSVFKAAGQAVHPVTGRPIAPVMGLGGAEWLDREEREREEQPQKAIAQFNLKPGMLIGDVGAGTGYYSLRMAKLVGPTGIVYANDIQPGMLEKLSAKASQAHVNNIVTVLGTESDPKLPANKLDLVICGQ